MSNVTGNSLEMQLEWLQINADHLFYLVMSCIIFLMQAGFAFLEAGSVRAKNTTNILLKNVLDVCIGALVYWAAGYAFAFGSEANAFIGYRYFFFESLPPRLYSHFFFHFVFAATAATIVSGAMAERTEFSAYLIYSSAITGFIYPIVTHWAWSSEGWLANGPENIYYQDFAGSGVVHCVGGTAALVGAAILGPRIGRYDENRKPQQMQGHTVPMVALGGFILFFGFLAFNGGSQASISVDGDGEVVALAIVNTIISGAFGALVSMVCRRIGLKGSYWSLLTTINGALTGMVAICAGCNAVYPWGAAVIGAVAGVTYIFWSWLIETLRVDDPLDAVAVHFGGGLWGVLATPLLAKDSGVVFTFTRVSWLAFGWNILGVLVIVVWSGVLSFILFGVMHVVGILRVSPEIEVKGLDIPKHGEPAYPQASYGSGWEEAIPANGVPKVYQDYTNRAFTNCQLNNVEYGKSREKEDTELPL